MRYLYDDFLTTEDFTQIRDSITHESFPWYARKGAASPEDNKPAFSNVLCGEYGPTCKEFELVVPLLRRLDCVSTLRIKANLDLKHEKGKVLDPESFHTDLEIHGKGLWSMVFYLNDCNGATMFEEDTVPVKSKANRAVIFPTHLRHTGCHQTDTIFRYVINVIFLAEKIPTKGKKF